MKDRKSILGCTDSAAAGDMNDWMLQCIKSLMYECVLLCV